MIGDPTEGQAAKGAADPDHAEDNYRRAVGDTVILRVGNEMDERNELANGN
jgi:hypothetical protein